MQHPAGKQPCGLNWCYHLTPLGVDAIGRKWFSAHCAAWFRRSPAPAHLDEVNGAASSSAEAQRLTHYNQVWWSSLMCWCTDAINETAAQQWTVCTHTLGQTYYFLRVTCLVVMVTIIITVRAQLRFLEDSLDWCWNYGWMNGVSCYISTLLLITPLWMTAI